MQEHQGIIRKGKETAELQAVCWSSALEYTRGTKGKQMTDSTVQNGASFFE